MTSPPPLYDNKSVSLSAPVAEASRNFSSKSSTLKTVCGAVQSRMLRQLYNSDVIGFPLFRSCLRFAWHSAIPRGCRAVVCLGACAKNKRQRQQKAEHPKSLFHCLSFPFPAPSLRIFRRERTNFFRSGQIAFGPNEPKKRLVRRPSRFRRPLFLGRYRTQK